MLPEFSLKEKEVTKPLPQTPCVSVIMQFEPKMINHSELEYNLQRVVNTVQKQLRSAFQGKNMESTISRLKSVVSKIDFTTFKKSLAIYVSPEVEKIFYLDIPVEEKIIIDDSFEIRDLVYSKKDLHKYLLLVLGGIRSRIYLGNTNTFLRIVSNTPEQIHFYENDISSRVSNFSDASQRKETIFNKFLHYVDIGLGHILNSYRLPLFVMGSARAIGHFKTITRHSAQVLHYIHGNYEDAKEGELRDAVAPYVADWKKVMQEDIMHQLDSAMGANKLAVGIKEVWKEAVNKKGSLLVVEKNYMHPVKFGYKPEIKNSQESESKRENFIKDAVDDVIEKVLEYGGDVEFVDDGVLKDYLKIALIKYY